MPLDNLIPIPTVRGDKSVLKPNDGNILTSGLISISNTREHTDVELFDFDVDNLLGDTSTTKRNEIKSDEKKKKTSSKDRDKKKHKAKAKKLDQNADDWSSSVKTWDSAAELEMAAAVRRKNGHMRNLEDEFATILSENVPIGTNVNLIKSTADPIALDENIVVTSINNGESSELSASFFQNDEKSVPSDSLSSAFSSTRRKDKNYPRESRIKSDPLDFSTSTNGTISSTFHSLFGTSNDSMPNESIEKRIISTQRNAPSYNDTMPEPHHPISSVSAKDNIQPDPLDTRPDSFLFTTQANIPQKLDKIQTIPSATDPLSPVATVSSSKRTHSSDNNTIKSVSARDTLLNDLLSDFSTSGMKNHTATDTTIPTSLSPSLSSSNVPETTKKMAPFSLTHSSTVDQNSELDQSTITPFNESLSYSPTLDIPVVKRHEKPPKHPETSNFNPLNEKKHEQEQETPVYVNMTSICNCQKHLNLENQLQEAEKVSKERIEQLTQELTTREESLSTLTQQLAARDESLSKLTQELTARENALTTERDESLSTLTQQLTARNESLSTLTQQLAARDESLSTLTQQLATREESLSTLTQQLAARDESLRTLTQELTARDESLRTLTQQVTTSQTELGTVRDELIRSKAAIQALTQQLTTTENNAHHHAFDTLVTQVQSAVARLTALHDEKVAATSAAALETDTRWRTLTSYEARSKRAAHEAEHTRSQVMDLLHEIERNAHSTRETAVAESARLTQEQQRLDALSTHWLAHAKAMEEHATLHKAQLAHEWAQVREDARILDARLSTRRYEVEQAEGQLYHARAEFAAFREQTALELDRERETVRGMQRALETSWNEVDRERNALEMEVGRHATQVKALAHERQQVTRLAEQLETGVHELQVREEQVANEAERVRRLDDSLLNREGRLQRLQEEIQVREQRLHGQIRCFERGRGREGGGNGGGGTRVAEKEKEEKEGRLLNWKREKKEEKGTTMKMATNQEKKKVIEKEKEEEDERMLMSGLSPAMRQQVEAHWHRQQAHRRQNLRPPRLAHKMQTGPSTWTRDQDTRRW